MKTGGSLLLTDKCDRLMPDASPEWANRIFSNKCVEYFIQNIHEVRGLTDESLYGVMFIIKVPKPIAGATGRVETVFINDQVENTGEPVRSIVFKITYINNLLQDQEILDRPSDYAPTVSNPDGKRKSSSSVNGFKEEVELQQQIYVQSAHLGEPLCPSILHAECLSLLNSNRLLTALIRYGDANARRFVGYIRHILNRNPDLRLGITIMDFMEGFQPFHDVMVNPTIHIDQRRMVAACAIYQNIRLMSLGYVHSDLHTSNMMVNMNNQKLLEGHPFKCIVIDFGRTVYNADLIRELFNVNMVLTDNFLHTILQQLYKQFRNSLYPREYYITDLLIQHYRIFADNTHMIQYMNDIIKNRINKIDRLVRENKYSDGTHPLCKRAYINKTGHPVIQGVILNNSVYIQEPTSVITQIRLNIDPFNKIDYLYQGQTIWVDVNDFDIMLYYISKNQHLLTNPLIDVILDYMRHQKSGKFIKRCNAHILYLDAIKNSSRYTDPRTGTVNTELEQFRNSEGMRFAQMGLIGMAPAGAVGVPAGAVGVPAGAVGVPTGAVGVPTGAVGVPTGAVGVPAQQTVQINEIYNDMTYLYSYLLGLGQSGPILTNIQSFITSYNNTSLSNREITLLRIYQTIKPNIDISIHNILQEKQRAFITILHTMKQHSVRLCNAPQPNVKRCNFIRQFNNHTKMNTIPLLRSITLQIINGSYRKIAQLNSILHQYQIASNETIRIISQPTAGGKRKTIKRKKSSKTIKRKMRSKRAKTRKN
jgi:hypothetical protein